MFEHIEATLREACGLTKDKPVIAGVSGGADSLCLMGILRDAGYRVVVAHFNHKLRSGSETDANAVGQIAERLNLESVIESGEVNAFAGAEKLSIEEAARILRYRFLMSVARRFNAQSVAVGHTADDQVETVLMHFIRGAGLDGLKGMTHRSIVRAFDSEIPIVRPLLDLWREETLAYCAEHKLQPLHDPSNDSLDFLRNRLRHTLIPALESYNPRFREALWRTSRSLAGDHEILAKVLDDAWLECIAQEEADFIAFNSAVLMKHPLGLQRNLLRRAIQRIHADTLDIGFAMLERAADFINDAARQNARLELAGSLHLLREGGLLYVVSGNTALPIEHFPQMPEGVTEIPVTIPGVVNLPGGWSLTCETLDAAPHAIEQARANADPFEVWLDAKAISASLKLRARRAGDRFEPLGMDGHKLKISDFLVNAKLPQRVRDHLPLLCVEAKIIWVPGFRPAHFCRLTESTERVFHLSLKREKKTQ
jgi:tRNA(Ile)-lysidine synthase